MFIFFFYPSSRCLRQNLMVMVMFIHFFIQAGYLKYGMYTHFISPLFHNQL